MMIVATLAMLLGCVPRGAIRYSPSPQDIMESYRQETETLLEYPIPRHAVLHRAGSFQEYAKDVHDSKFSYRPKEGGIQDVADLMDWSFKELDADGIEIDVQTVPGSEKFDKVYIVHDPIRAENGLSDDACDYLEKNELEDVLKRYISENYFKTGKGNKRERFLYIELKCAKGCFRLRHHALSDEEKAYLEKVVSRISKLLPDNDQATSERIRRHIAFASFNLGALEHTYRFMKERGEESGHRFFFIAATNKPILGRIACLFSREINYLDEDLTNRIINASWLDGIWFDPSGMNVIAKTFNNINRRRKDGPLDIHISTYKLCKKQYLKKMRKEMAVQGTETLQHVKGMIYEIQR